MSFFSPATHSASVRAKTDVQLLRLARADYDDLIRDGVSAGYKVAYNVLQSMADRLRRMDDWVARLAAHQVTNAAQTRTAPRNNRNGSCSATSCSTTGICRPDSS